jgi:hypothetical protein
MSGTGPDRTRPNNRNKHAKMDGPTEQTNEHGQKQASLVGFCKRAAPDPTGPNNRNEHAKK